MTPPPLPAPLARRPNRVLRPRDAADVYAQPRGELARLARAGVLRRLTTGYYAIMPQQRIGDPRWVPEIAAVGLAIALADYQRDDVTLMGITAARQHRAVPRALAVAVVAVPKQRPLLHTVAGDVVFVRRNVARLDVEAVHTELVDGWVTTAEQTILDLADRPALGGLGEHDLRDAVRTLGQRADIALLRRLAGEQRKPTALIHAHRMMGLPGA